VKIDIFPHIYPKRFAERALSLSSAGLYMQKRFREIPVLTDLDLRFRIMDRYGDYVQVLTLSSPLPGFVASLPMNNSEAALREMDRAVTGLGATGVQIFSNVNGRPLDEAEFQPLFAGMAAFNLPVWLHPARSPDFPDYQTEKRSRYDFWWVFGWPYETTIAMGRLVFSGIFDRHPDLMIIAHHLGAMIPFFAERAGSGLDQLGSRTEDPDDAVALGRLRRRPLDYFRLFYGDTALFGARPGLECGLAFFGADHVLFGTDMPFDPEKGPGYIRETIRCLEEMRASSEEKAKIYEGNARRLLKLKLP
jgi:predicted TIM-barrel fold metal-dependent hydrolase